MTKTFGAFQPAPGYYTVSFNPELLEYSIDAIDLTAHQVRTEMHITGKGYVDYPDQDWNPAVDPITLSTNFDSRGDYVFGIECLKLNDDVAMKFVGQLSWDGLDAGFINGGEQTAPLEWVKADVGDGTAALDLKDQAGFYNVSFDYLINRINVIPNTSGTCE